MASCPKYEIEPCGHDPECEACAERVCPRQDRLHNHHDGCPSCVDEELTAWGKFRKLLLAVQLDCQPKSKEDAVYVSEKWRQAVLEATGKLA